MQYLRAGGGHETLNYSSEKMDLDMDMKCPFSQRICTVQKAVSSKDFFIKVREDRRYEFDGNYAYWHEIQGQMHILYRNYCYFVVWTTKEALVM